MRVVVYGTGAIGGTVAGALARAGGDVIAIARGAQLAALRENGLRLRSPMADEVIRFPVAADPEEARIGSDDAILLTMKSQHTLSALEALRDAGVEDQPIFLLQNGVDNERKALRMFPNVHGVTLLMPAAFVRPGEVVAWGEPQHGIFDIGLATGGHDTADETLAAALTLANIAAFVSDDVMASKYGKLLLNLDNILVAALGSGVAPAELRARVRAEAEAVLGIAGISWAELGDDPRRDRHTRKGAVPGVEDIGTSTAQSLLRGTGSVETDWLNGEIALLGRLHGVPVPVNAALTRLGARMARDGLAPGSIPLTELLALVG